MNTKVIILLLCVAALCSSCSSPPPGTVDWEALKGPAAREITTVFSDHFLANVVYAGLSTGDIFRSDDNGSTWAKISSIEGGARIYRFYSSVDTPAVLYAATSQGLFSSSRNKRQWTPFYIQSIPPHTAIRAMACDPWVPSVMFIGTENHGIFTSTDAGTTWTPSNGTTEGLSNATIYDIAVDFKKPDHLVASAFGLGVIVSRDAGKSWQRATPEITATGSQVCRVLMGPSGSQEILYATYAGNMARSTDGGTSWIPVRVSREGTEISSLDQSHAVPARLLAGTESGLLLSTDFGSTWRDYSGPLPHVKISGSLHALVDSTAFAYGETIGMQRTNSGGASWTTADLGLGGASFRFLTCNGSATRIYAVLTGTMLAYDVQNNLWSPMGPGLSGDTIAAVAVTGNNALSVLAATNVGAFRSTDGGHSWSQLSNKLPLLAHSLEINPAVPARILAAGEPGVFISSDRGATWKKTQPVMERFDINAFTFDATNATVIYAASRHNALITSRDGGFSWEQTRYGITTDEIATVTLDDRDRAVVYAWTPNHQAFRTLNSGLEWNRYSPPWKEQDTVVMGIDHYLPSSVVAVINNRQLLYSVNGGGTWVELPMPPAPGEISTLLWNEDAGTLYAGIRHLGLHRLHLKSIIAKRMGE